MNSYEIIKKELQNLAGEVDTFSLDIPDENAHGDYATNIAFPLSKKEDLSPKVWAENNVVKLQEQLKDIVEKIEVAGVGFINFFLKDEVIRKENEQEGAHITTQFKGKNVLVEHSSPNLFKPFHIGHLMNNIVGEFVTRATRKGGANVETMSFPSDVSLGIAKAIYILKKDIAGGKDILANEKDEEKVISYLGDCYVRGVNLTEENPNLEGEIREISKKLFDEIENNPVYLAGTTGRSDEYKLWVDTKTKNIVYLDQILEGLGSSTGFHIYESEAGFSGRKIVLENIPNIFTNSEGAVVYIPDESRKDLHTAVFINKDNHPTYEAKDLALIEMKFTGRPNLYSSFTVTDTQQTSHFKVVLDAASKLGGNWPEWVSKSKHITHGRMLFKGQKMSSRLGGVPLALDVIGVVEEEVREKAGDKISHLSEEERKKLEREIALSALRISVLRSKPGLNINFDPETSLSFEGDSGPYLLYTHARCASLLDKANIEKGYTQKFSDTAPTSLEKDLEKFNYVLEDVVETLSPQKLVAYLFKIAQGFNSFYASTQIISDDKVASEHNLAIVKRTKFVLKEALNVLGINAPERM